MSDDKGFEYANLAYPLAWPQGTPRTAISARRSSRFRISSFGVARDECVRQLELLGSNYIIISTNVRTKPDGLPYATEREPEDPGAAIYFDMDGAQRSMACDRWDTLLDNVWALAKTVEAMRGIERWGSSELMKRAFSAFAALPPASTPPPENWRDVFEMPPYLRQPGVPRPVLAGWLKDQYRVFAQKTHPDAGGTNEAFQRVQAAYDAAKAELRL